MTDSVNAFYAQRAGKFLAREIYTVPVEPGTKACKIPGWADLLSDPNRDDKIHEWIKKYPNHGIGVLLGSRIPASNRVLACIDIDNDAYVAPILGMFAERKGALIRKQGKRGITLFVQADEKLKNGKFYFPGNAEDGTKRELVAELFVHRTMTVIPPSVHPETKAAYRWFGQSLLDVSLKTLPVLEGVLK